jgi:hypothetical protein
MPDPETPPATPPAAPPAKTYTEADVAGLKSKTEELLTKLTAANQRAALLGDLTAEQLKADLDLAKATREKKAKDEGDFAALSKQKDDFHAAELTKVGGRVKKLEGKLFDTLAKRETEAEIVAAGGNPKMLLPHLLPHVQVTEQDEEFGVQVVDAKGKPRIADGQGTPMSIKQLVEQFKGDPVFAPAFAASGAGGSGARNGGPAGAVGQIVLSGADAKDPQKYRAAKKKADEAGVSLTIQG